jgi:gliding motility-associatede transport system auxiliary component
MKLGQKTLFIVLLLAGLVLLNYLASQIPVRGDATADHIYTLSSGTKALLAKVDEPITIDFYFSESASGLRIEVKNYADRVREMLRQYVRASHGKITINVIDPAPDTPQEEKATAAGIEAQRAQTGAEPFYLGLVATQAEQQKAIPALTPDREQFLEYDLSELIYNVQQLDKKKLGLITSLPLNGTPGNPMMGQQDQPGQYVVTEWQDTFDIVPVEATATDLPPKLDALAIVHPENLTPKLQYAIDQFLLSGKPVFIAVDPASQFFKSQGGQMAMMQGPQPNVSSDLPVLLGGWGIAFNPQKIIGDNAAATQLQNPNDGSVARYPTWLSLDQDSFNSRALATAQLSTMLFVEPGSLSLKAGTALTWTPLVQTSATAGELDSAALQFAQPDDLARQLTPSGKKTIAALVSGKFHTAFPGGMPKDEPAPDADKKTPAPAPAPAPAAPGLLESAGNSTLIVVADTDWLLDDYSIRKFNVLGTAGAEPLNDNLSFAANALDFLAGSQDLISIRGKGSSVRPFTVVAAMETKAAAQYQEKLTGLEAQLTAVQAKITDLEGKKSEGNHLVASPEAAKAIEEFQQQAATLRAERRGIRLALRQDIDALEHRLLALNLFATPLLVCLFGVWFYRARKQSR